MDPSRTFSESLLVNENPEKNQEYISHSVSKTCPTVTLYDTRSPDQAE